LLSRFERATFGATRFRATHVAGTLVGLLHMSRNRENGNVVVVVLSSFSSP
jgi:hypothetical protein